MESKVKNENHIVIHGWMVNKLGLKGNELLVYAIIYGFSQTEGQKYIGSLQYLADWTNSTKQGVIKSLIRRSVMRWLRMSGFQNLVLFALQEKVEKRQ